MTRTSKLLALLLVLVVLVESVFFYNRAKQVTEANKMVYGIYTDTIQLSENTIKSYRTSNSVNELYSLKEQLLFLDNIYGRLDSNATLGANTHHYPPSAFMDILLSSHTDTKLVNQYIDIIQSTFSRYLSGLNLNSYKNNTDYVQMWNKLQVETNQFKIANKIGS